MEMYTITYTSSIEPDAARDDHTQDATSAGEAVEACARGSWVRVPWSAVGDEGEDELAQSAITVRCLTRADASVLDSHSRPDLVAYVARFELAANCPISNIMSTNSLRRSFCALADGAASPVVSGIKLFREEFELGAHTPVVGGIPAGSFCASSAGRRDRITPRARRWPGGG